MTTLPTQQTLAIGQTPSSRYGKLGGYGGRTYLPAQKILAYIVSFPGEGKSHFLQEIPDSYTFNFDLSSTVTPHAKTTFFPGLDPKTGLALGDNNTPIVLGFQHFLDKRDILLDLARTNTPDRPATIVIETITSLLRSAMPWIVANATRVGITNTPVSYFNQLNGKAAYDVIYREIVDSLVALRDAGYGVWVSGHIVNAKQQVGDDQFVTKPESALTDGFWKRIYNIFEYVGYLYSEPKSETTTQETTQTMADGRKVTTKRPLTTTRTARYLTSVRNSLQGVTKSRLEGFLPDRIELLPSGAWESFDSAYSKAITLALAPKDPSS